jgi:parallel beta-helix repeat protein
VNCLDNNIFSGFYFALLVNNSGKTPSITIDNNTFSNNFYGIRLGATNNASITNNQFNLDLSFSSGIYAYQSTGYIITENTFSGTRDFLKNTGIIIERSGVEENVIYKNIFDKLFVGIQAIDQNSAQDTINPAKDRGLQFLCNVFSKIQETDILVGDLSSGHVDHSVRTIQGDPQLPAGNEFYGDYRISISNYSNYLIEYYLSDLSLPEFPIDLLGLIIKYDLSILSDCPSRNSRVGMDLVQALRQYNDWNTEYEYWLAQLLTYDGDDEEGYSLLSGWVSHFSGIKDNFFNEIIVAVMKNEVEVQGGLFGNSKLETLRFLFTYRGHYTDYLSIIETYLAENNFSEALATLAKMYMFEISDEQVSELNGMETYINWLQQLENEKKNIYTLIDEDISYLINYVETNTGRGVVFANNILCGLYGICIEEEGDRSQNTGDRNNEEILNQSKSAQSVSSEFEKSITIVPNPTTGELQVTSYELQVTSIEVFDVYGRAVSTHYSLLTTHYSINISHLQAGLYFVKIVTEQGEVVKKVVKQ